VEISVQDSGVGIAPEDLPQVFEPFFTSPASGAGTGLGLYLSKNIIEMHQGTLSVVSEKLRGSRFTITLPGV